jgi:hypothetical protein
VPFEERSEAKIMLRSARAVRASAAESRDVFPTDTPRVMPYAPVDQDAPIE